jgi:deoxyguanosine kinase
VGWDLLPSRAFAGILSLKNGLTRLTRLTLSGFHAERGNQEMQGPPRCVGSRPEDKDKGQKNKLMYIAIEGVIGVGKTTLARLLQPAFGCELLLEVFEENPFLSDFYKDRERYAFQTQIFFLLSRYQQQRRSVPGILKSGDSLIGDYTFEKDALFARINLEGDELDMYYRVHEALAEKIPVPDLIVYLRAETDVLMQRIAQRDRPYERNMERAYIDELNRAYEVFFGDHVSRRSPVLALDTNHLDYVRRLDDLKFVENRIRQALKMAPFQPELPLENAAD